MKLFAHANRPPFIVSLAISILTAGLAHGDGRMPDCYVLSAGVDNYPGANKLSGCLNDARNTTAAFRAQQGKLFGTVHAQTLLDGQATRHAIHQHMEKFAQQGTAGDFMVLFLSGHGARHGGNGWYFLPYDFNPRNTGATTITDRQILDASDGLVKQGKKVVVIVDACFSGQLNVAAQPYLKQYRDPNGGGLIVMVSSSASQTSAALGQYSAFAKAFADSMDGQADLNRDGKVTIEEIRRFSRDRTTQLLRQKGMGERQDSEVAWSPSISANMPLAALQQLADSRPTPQPPPIAKPRLPEKPVVPVVPETGKTQSTQWTGSENLAGFGKLAFTTYPGGRAVMTDARGAQEGNWKQQGKVITMTFSGGRIVYTGNLDGARLAGTAHNERTSWSWNVQQARTAEERADDGFAGGGN